MSQQISLNKTTKINLSVRFLSVLLVILCTVVSTKAAGEVDPTFNPVPSKEVGSSLSGGLVLQPDGKILVFGSVGNNPTASYFQRLNSDGTIDSSFNCTICNSFSVGNALIQPDGKIIVAGNVSEESRASALIVRLNPDGSQDNTFVYPFAQSGFNNYSSASVQEIQPDGKILYILRESFSGASGSSIRRLNPNGSFDSSFTPISTGFGRQFQTNFSKIMRLASGKILIGINSGSAFISTGALQRHDSDGARDTSFEAPTFSDSSFDQSLVSGFEVLPDGSILVAGRFTTVNGAQRVNLVKLQPAGNVDLSFSPQIAFNFGEYLSGVKLLSNGQILISVANISNSTTNRLLRLNANGTVDNSFNPPANLSNIGALAVDAQNRIVLLGQFGENKRYARLNADGSLDQTFNVELIAPGSVQVIAVQPDGKAIVYGGFTKMNNVPRNNLARLNADGTTDPTFDPGSGFNSQVNVIVVQPDGKILVGGEFTSYNGEPRSKLARLLPNGSLDNGFTANVTQSGAVYSIALQPDGKILVGGSFTGINDTLRNSLARLNANGTVDTTFNAGFGSAAIYSILTQSDGKILVGGSFNGVGGFNRANLARLNADGSLDSGFNAGSISSIKQIQMQTDGKYVVLIGNSSVARLNNNGSGDNSFQPAVFVAPSGNTTNVNSILVESDNTIVVGGNFTTVNNIPRSRIVRLRSDGRVDLTFLPQGANRQVFALARQADGKILVGGEFTLIGNVTRYGIARLAASPFRNITPFDFDGDGRADFTVFRPAGANWYIFNSSNNSFTATHFGVSSDVIAPADYDGDGRADIAVFRPTGAGDPNKAYFYIQQSQSNSFRAEQFGRQGDVPVSGDWDGDGLADLAVYRDGSQTGGQSYFFYRPSSQPGADFRAITWGTAGDKPVPGDYDGDGKLDAAVFRPSIARWYILRSSDNQFVQRQFGVSTDIPTPADFDGDGITNFAVYRPSTGTWYTSTDPATNYGEVRWGISTDIPVAADYDGDGRADIAVFRPESGNWYVLRSTSGFFGIQWGIATDKPAPAAYVP
ncbi:MAG TPA: FG-GAP-like repeat-containing protein [Pyrinomonadaceae bacterium]|jgi:uncharacterized delta-60 repeat protein